MPLSEETIGAINSDHWGLYVLPDGLNSIPRYIGCVQVDDLTKPLAGLGLNICFNAVKGEYEVIGSFQTAPDKVTTTFTVNQGKHRGYMNVLEEQGCMFPFLLLHHSCGEAGLVDNWDQGIGVRNAKIVTSTISGLPQFTDQKGTTDAFAIEAWFPAYAYWELSAERVATAEVLSLNSISVCNVPTCANGCGAASGVCEDMYIGCDSAAGPATANVLRTTDYGVTWPNTATDPFLADEHNAVKCFPYGTSGTRALAVRLSTDAGNPAECAVSDDAGATWTNYNIGAVNGEFVVSAHALEIYDQYHIWCGTDQGNIYFSADGGETWALQDGTAIAANVRCISAATINFVFACGDGDDVAITNDGGTVWAAATATGSAAALNVIRSINGATVWCGTAGGTLYYSNDRCTTWTQRAFPGDGVGQVRDLAIRSGGMEIFMAHNTAAPLGRLLRSVTGGYSWLAVTMPTNSGFNAMVTCDDNTLWIVGEANSGTGVIVKVHPATE